MKRKAKIEEEEKDDDEKKDNPEFKDEKEDEEEKVEEEEEEEKKKEEEEEVDPFAPEEMKEDLTEEEELHWKMAQIIHNASRVVFFTGAGMSAESGIGTFRGGKGLWNGITGAVALGYFGTPVGWKTTPRLAWKLYRKHFFKAIGEASPNIGHKAIGELGKIKNVKVVTQNVDGLHQRGGTKDEDCYEVHGTVRKHKCIKNGHPIDLGEITTDIPEKSQKCKICGSYMRPDFVLFTEALPDDIWSNAVKSVNNLSREDCLIVIGTSSVVYPAASIPEIANENGVKIIEINLEMTTFSKMRNTVFVKGKAGEVMTSLVKKVKQLNLESL